MLEKVIFIRYEFKWKSIGSHRFVRIIGLFSSEHFVFDLVDEDIRSLHCSEVCSTNSTAISFIGGEKKLLKISDLYVHDDSTDVIMTYNLFRKIVTTFKEFDKIYGEYWTGTSERIELEVDVDIDYFMACVTPSVIIPKGMSMIEYKMRLKNKKKEE